MATSGYGEGGGEVVAMVTMPWQVGLGAGILMIILGIVIAAHPTTSLNVICVLIGITVLIGGVFRLVRSFDRAESNRALTAVVGVLMLAVGVLLIRHLDFSRLLIALVVGIVFILQGAADFMRGLSGWPREGRVWHIVAGLLSIAAGIVVLAVPENSITFLASLVGIIFIILGIVQVIEAFVIRHILRSEGRDDGDDGGTPTLAV